MYMYMSLSLSLYVYIYIYTHMKVAIFPKDKVCDNFYQESGGGHLSQTTCPTHVFFNSCE